MTHYCNLYIVRMFMFLFMKCIVLLRDIIQVHICVIQETTINDDRLIYYRVLVSFHSQEPERH